MKETYLTIVFMSFAFIIIGVLIGMAFASYSEIKIMEPYDLYNCIYNNALHNDFTNNLHLVKDIQDECICFREFNYTNLSESNCIK